MAGGTRPSDGPGNFPEDIKAGDPLSSFEEITPGNSDLTNGTTRAILLAETGTVTVLGENDSVAVELPLVGGVWHPIRAKRITAASADVFAGR